MLHSRKARIDIQDTMSKRADLTKRNTSIREILFYLDLFYNVKIH